MSIDPGQQSGIVVLDIADQTVVLVHAGECASAWDVLSLIHQHGPDVVVVEDFVLRKDKAVQLSGQRMFAAEVIGAVKEYCRSRCTEVIRQPVVGKATIGRSLLEQTGLWQVTVGKPHARDAAKHALTYLLTRKMIKI